MERRCRDIVHYKWYTKKRQNGAKHCIKMIAPVSVVVKADFQIDSISIFLFFEAMLKTREFFPITIEAKAHITKITEYPE